MFLVTGGLGFLGAHVCRNLLEKGEEVVAYDFVNPEKRKIIEQLRIPDIKDKIKVVDGDITNFDKVYQTLKEYSVDKVIHTAAVIDIPTAIKNPKMTFKVNIEGSFNFFEAARVLDLKKVVSMSTASVYGNFDGVISEDHIPKPVDIYGAMKLAADTMSLGYNSTYGLNTTIIRTTSLYGIGDLESRVIRNFVESALIGKELELAGGEQTRNFSYVKDVARGVSLAALSDKTKGEIIHLSGEKDYSLNELVDVISKFIPNMQIKRSPSRKLDTSRGILGLEKAHKLLGYKPEYNLEKGLKEFIKWFVDVCAPGLNLNIVNKPKL